MKLLYISICVLAVCASIFFGISHLTIKNTQHQKQAVHQIQAQHNVHLTIVDTSKRYTNIVWVMTNFGGLHQNEVVEFMNTELNFFQQREAKFGAAYHGDITLLYPVIAEEVEAYTNNSDIYSTNEADIKIDFLKGWF